MYSYRDRESLSKRYMFITLQCSGLFYTLFMISRQTKNFQALAGLLVIYSFIIIYSYILLLSYFSSIYSCLFLYNNVSRQKQENLGI